MWIILTALQAWWVQSYEINSGQRFCHWHLCMYNHVSNGVLHSVTKPRSNISWVHSQLAGLISLKQSELSRIHGYHLPVSAKTIELHILMQTESQTLLEYRAAAAANIEEFLYASDQIRTCRSISIRLKGPYHSCLSRSLLRLEENSFHFLALRTLLVRSR